MNKKIFFFITIAIAITIILIIAFSPKDKYSGDEKVFTQFEKDTKNINKNIKSIIRYNQDDIYYYSFKFSYKLGEENGNSELIYVYNDSKKNIMFFNINDIEFYPNEYNDYLKASSNGTSKQISLSEFDSFVKKKDE